MTTKNRCFLGVLLLDLAVVFVFAMWPLHRQLAASGTFSASSVNCGNALAPKMTTDTGGGVSSQECPDVVGHRRALLFGLGGGALVLAVFGLELAFAVKRPEQSSENNRDQPEPVSSDDATVAAPEMSTELLDKLERLGRLRASGVLTEEEFASQKANLLAGVAS